MGGASFAHLISELSATKPGMESLRQVGETMDEGDRARARNVAIWVVGLPIVVGTGLASSSAADFGAASTGHTDTKNAAAAAVPGADVKAHHAELENTFTKILEAMQWDTWFSYTDHRLPDEPPTAWELQRLMNELENAQSALIAEIEIDDTRESV
ncbi:hypothetical protein B0A48_13066 [Cryoendolithus antarcticus]|uniref:Uncharacterized protein n=1 Tax=Cryoendolithus antarcticus TaxID=1507870 RepID=A0A1V8SN34_9PEZI|nr:hypothetical protein B0A48_13066 [Cryoendolithus antarcticus]